MNEYKELVEKLTESNDTLNEMAGKKKFSIATLRKDINKLIDYVELGVELDTKGKSKNKLYDIDEFLVKAWNRTQQA